MAAASVYTSTFADGLESERKISLEPQLDRSPETPRTVKHDVATILNYFKDNEDGSPPHPTYVDRPETFTRPFESHSVTIKDIAGEESKYTLDKNGFQVHGHVSTERDFLDNDQIKASYYPETEQLLKDVYAKRS